MTDAPIPLTREIIEACRTWARDDRLWSTQETTEFNLCTFARLVLKGVPDSSAGPSPRDEAPTLSFSEMLDWIKLMPDHQVDQILDFIRTLRECRVLSGQSSATEVPSRDEAIRTLIAQMRQWVIVQRTDPPSATVTDYTAEIIVGWADELESLVGAIERQDDK